MDRLILNISKAILLVLLVLPAGAASYYVDFSGGSDAAAGTSSGAAWKHCPGDSSATGTAAATTFAAGDTVFFRGGVTYTGQVSIAWSGTSGNRITYDGTGASFGSGRATIDGGYANNGYCLSAASGVGGINVLGFAVQNAGGWSDTDPAVTNYALAVSRVDGAASQFRQFYSAAGGFGGIIARWAADKSLAYYDTMDSLVKVYKS